MTLLIRAAKTADHPAVADVLIASRLSSIPAIPPPVHSEAEMREWARDIVLPTYDVWVVDDGAPELLGVLALSPGWIEHLYIAPGHTGAGLGSMLVDLTSMGS